MQPDQETLAVLSEGELVKQLTEHGGWAIVKGRFDKKILDLQSVLNINASTAEEVFADIKARKTAVEILVEFMKEIYGIAAQYDSNKKPFEEADVFLRRE